MFLSFLITVLCIDGDDLISDMFACMYVSFIIIFFIQKEKKNELLWSEFLHTHEFGMKEENQKKMKKEARYIDETDKRILIKIRFSQFKTKHTKKNIQSNSTQFDSIWK